MYSFKVNHQKSNSYNEVVDLLKDGDYAFAKALENLIARFHHKRTTSFGELLQKER